MAFRKGDKIAWNTPQGQTEGSVVEKHEKEFTFDGQKFNASKDEPYYTVESAKSGKRAAHKESALTKK
ncbi:DUF2945 domain-containing protein [Arthrobacter echini]|uniref:DUF2945 domain-containing protein n=1 Tax=Arthrobacter echini TaxID=1529066 RepID=A0A4S5E5D0_9MICC|nr:DUF2945 domain-containing protein [Arthrobacter echini]THJ66714.1 DUF2945 domain-containing protein [Arthrobacter echini]